MKLEDIMGTADELPLERIANDGGFVDIFRTIACVGDSLSSGEFEVKDAAGNKMFIDRFDYSWGQYLGRMAGSKVYNFSKGGMTAREYRNSFANKMGYWQRDLAANAYIIALGVNDIFNQKHEVGSFDDISYDDYTKNEDTFIGNYAYIIQRYKEIQPEARFFLVGVPNSGRNPEAMAAHDSAVRGLAERFDNTYYLDLAKYACTYDTDFRHNFFLLGHMAPTGYVFTAKIIVSYIDYIIRHNMHDFRDVGLMGFDYDRDSIN